MLYDILYFFVNKTGYIMNLRQIFALEPVSTNHFFAMAFSATANIYGQDGQMSSISNFINNIEVDYDLHEIIEAEKRIEIRMYMDEGDDKWGATLYGVFFDNSPIMLVKNTGRYLSDYTVYPTNEEAFSQYEAYLRSKLQEAVVNFEDMDTDIENLDVVGDYNLFDYYTIGHEPKYQVNDIVWAWVNEAKYGISKKGFVLTRARIEKVNKFSKIETYHAVQIDRSFDAAQTTLYKPASDMYTSSGLGAVLKDSMIIGKVQEMDTPQDAIENYVDSNGYLPEDYYKMITI